MTTHSPKADRRPARGEIWLICFDPAEGAEIDKKRPAVVLSPPGVGRLPLRIVVPLTSWQEKFITVPWLLHIKPTRRNGLHKESTADCFQVKSVSLDRFVAKLGDLDVEELAEVCAGVALCAGL